LRVGQIVERRADQRACRVLSARRDLIYLGGRSWLARCEVADPLSEGRRRDMGRPPPPLCASARRYQALRRPSPGDEPWDLDLPTWLILVALTLGAAAWGWLIGVLTFA